VFTAEVVRFDPVVTPASAHAESNQENRASLRRSSPKGKSGSPSENFEQINRKVVFRILETFSGPEITATEMWTHSQSTACGYQFTVGTNYLVEAQLWPPNQPRWAIAKCSRTAELGTSSTNEEVGILQLWKAEKRPPAWIRGRMFGYNETSQIAGVRLQLTDGKVTRFAQSGADGVFYFGGLSSGVYTLTADMPGPRNRVTVDLREQWSAGPVFYVGFPN